MESRHLVFMWLGLYVTAYIPYMPISDGMPLLLHKDKETKGSSINKGDVLQISLYCKCFNQEAMMLNYEKTVVSLTNPLRYGHSS